LTAYKAVSVESIRFINTEMKNLETARIRASDILGCVSAGVSAALSDSIPYKNTPALIRIAGALGAGKNARGMPAIPYAGITMAGVNWGISGSLARGRALEASAEAGIETEKMARVLAGLKAIRKRAAEGEALLHTLSGKLRKSLDTLQSADRGGGALPETAAKEIDVSIRLVRSLKQIIETDICNAGGFLSRKSGVIFRKIKQEVCDV